MTVSLTACKATETPATDPSGPNEKQTTTSEEHSIYYVQPDGLYANNLKTGQKVLVHASDKISSRNNPLLPSPTGEYIAYEDGGELKISKVDFAKPDQEPTTILTWYDSTAGGVPEKQMSYAWLDDETIMATAELQMAVHKMGVYNMKKQNSFGIIDIPTYNNLTMSSNGMLYAETEGIGYGPVVSAEDRSTSIVGFNVEDLDFDGLLQEKKIIFQGVPISENDMGTDYTIAGVSPDGTKLLAWSHPRSASITTDGARLVAYDLAIDKEILLDEELMLTYKDNVSFNPQISNQVVLNMGTDRNVGTNKYLKVLDLQSDIFKGVLAESFQEGAVTAYPSFSKDGTQLAYSYAMETEWGTDFAMPGYGINKRNMTSGDIDSITEPGTIDQYDFAPIFVDNDQKIIFSRWNGKDTLSLTMTDAMEPKQTQDLDIHIPFSLDDTYYGHLDTQRFYVIK